MKKIIVTKLLEHQSLFIIVFSAVCYFFVNVLLKEKLSDVAYGEYSMIITFFSMIFIYGLLGLEQGFAKYSLVVKENIIETNEFQFKLVFISIILVSVFSSLFLIYYYSSLSINFFLIVIASICMSSLLFLYTLFRLNSNFVSAQLMQNGFKLILFFAVLILLNIKRFYDNEIVLILLGSIIITFLIGLFKIKKIKIRFVDKVSKRTVIISGIFFLVSTATFSLINFADRYLIEYKFGLKVVGDYFYLFNVFLAPFSILQGYIGFKKLTHYKNSFSVLDFKKNNNKSLTYGFLLSVLLLIFYFLIIKVKIVTFDFLIYRNTVFLLLILGILKIYSAGIYPAFDVIIDVKNLIKAKTIILIISLSILIIAFFFAQSIELIIVSLIIIWFLKTSIMSWFLIYQEKNKNFE